MNKTQAILRPLLIAVSLGCVLAMTLGRRPEFLGPVAAHPGTVDVAVEDEESRLDALERRVAEASARARESTLVLEYAATESPSGARRVATGLVIDEQGNVLSVRIDPPPTDAPVMARDASGRRYLAKWVAADAETGLTLLRIDAPDLGLRPIRASDGEARLGSQVLVIGNPFGLGHSVRRGQVAGLDRRLELGNRQLGGLIQVDAALHPGDSGALVANLKGEWLGLIRSGLTTPDARKARDHDLGFAIPARDALWVADQLRAHQRVNRAFLGVQIDPTATDGPPGAVLGSVLPDTPAARAGLQSGDRVVAIDGQPVQSPLNLTDRLDRTLAHTEVTIERLRGSDRDRLVVQTASRPPLVLPSSAPSPSAPPPTPRTDDLRLTLPREVLDRLDHLERRIEELEKEKLGKPSS